jgi:hypothetical protein
MQNGFSPAWTLKSVKTEYPNDGFGLPSKTDYIATGASKKSGQINYIQVSVLHLS